MAFDIDKMYLHCRSKIALFAREHSDEMFYAFAIDAGMLCLNSEEQFARTLTAYQSAWDRQTRHINSIDELTEEDLSEEKFGLDLAEKYSGLNRSDDAAVLQKINEGRSYRRSKECKYRTDKGIKELRENPGDWAYQGFADLDEQFGYDADLYDDHYYAAMESDDGHAPDTDYAVAMTRLVSRLRESNAFDGLRRTDEFVVTWVDHSY